MAVEKLSDGDPSVLVIGMYGGDQLSFDSVLGTKLLDQLKKLVGVYLVHPFETDYKDMPEVDFTMSTGPPARARMLGEDASWKQKYDKDVSFEDVTQSRTCVAKVILQEFPWPPPQNKGALNFSVGPPGPQLMPPQWGRGWFEYRGVYWLYPFADKQESRPEKKEDFVFLKYSTPHARLEESFDFSVPLIKALEELGVEYFQGKYPFEERIPHGEFISKMNRAKLYFQVKAESYGLTKWEAVASEAIVIGSPHTLFRTAYVNEFGFKHVPTAGVETLKKAITMGLEAYDKPRVQEHLHAMREKLWSYGRLAREMVDILRELKGSK